MHKSTTRAQRTPQSYTDYINMQNHNTCAENTPKQSNNSVEVPTDALYVSL